MAARNFLRSSMRDDPNQQPPTAAPAARPLSKGPQRPGGFFGRLIESPLFWIVFVLFAFGLPIVQSLRRPAVIQPPVLGQLPEFHLINQDGKPVGLPELKGSVLVVDFIFTSCP